MNERSELAQVRIEEMQDSGKEGPPHLLLIGGDPGVLRVPDLRLRLQANRLRPQKS